MEDAGVLALPRPVPEHVPGYVLGAQAAAVVTCALLVALTAPTTHWDILLAFGLLSLALLSDLMAVEVADRVNISGSFLAIVLAIILLGGPPAALIGICTVLVGRRRTQEPAHALRQNLVVYALFPLAGAVLFSAARRHFGLSAEDAGLYVLVLATFTFTLACNFVLVATYVAAVRGIRIASTVREAVVPLISSEALTALLAVAVVYLQLRIGFAATVLAGVAILSFQHLLSQLLVSRRRADELSALTSRLHVQALTDPLTGLDNRRRLMEDLATALAGDDERGTDPQPHVLALYDLDGFKQYNDAFGHPEGDELLATLGARLAETARGRGRAYRLGGDEFCVLARGELSDLDPLLHDAAASLTAHGDRFDVTCSWGRVLLPAEASTPVAALRLADQRMYLRKDSRPSSPKHQAGSVLLEVLREQQPNLHDHVGGVTRLAVAVARELGLDESGIDDVARAAELHDVGKMAIPWDILNKPGPLDAEEWEVMRRHTEIGARMLEAAPALAGVARMVRASHERWDGTGYPDRLAGRDIPLGARIVAVCDAFEAMTAARPYKRPRSTDWSLAELRRCAGTHFDPAVVEAFVLAFRREQEAESRPDAEAQPEAATG